MPDERMWASAARGTVSARTVVYRFSTRDSRPYKTYVPHGSRRRKTSSVPGRSLYRYIIKTIFSSEVCVTARGGMAGGGGWETGERPERNRRGVRTRVFSSVTFNWQISGRRAARNSSGAAREFLRENDWDEWCHVASTNRRKPSRF